MTPQHSSAPVSVHPAVDSLFVEMPIGCRSSLSVSRGRVYSVAHPTCSAFNRLPGIRNARSTHQSNFVTAAPPCCGHSNAQLRSRGITNRERLNTSLEYTQSDLHFSYPIHAKPSLAQYMARLTRYPPHDGAGATESTWSTILQQLAILHTTGTAHVSGVLCEVRDVIQVPQGKSSQKTGMVRPAQECPQTIRADPYADASASLHLNPEPLHH